MHLRLRPRPHPHSWLLAPDRVQCLLNVFFFYEYIHIYFFPLLTVRCKWLWPHAAAAAANVFPLFRFCPLSAHCPFGILWRRLLHSATFTLWNCKCCHIHQKLGERLAATLDNKAQCWKTLKVRNSSCCYLYIYTYIAKTFLHSALAAQCLLSCTCRLVRVCKNGF